MNAIIIDKDYSVFFENVKKRLAIAQFRAANMLSNPT
jgi:hypothetical protein